MNKIKMYISATIPYKKEYDIKSITPCIGGFEFRFGHKIIPFDFDDWGCEVNKCLDVLIIEWTSGRSFLKSDGISEDYRENILGVGIDPDKITAEFLSKTDEITRINTDISVRDKEGKIINISDTPSIMTVLFVDENYKTYNVDAKKISEYNKKMEEE